MFDHKIKTLDEIHAVLKDSGKTIVLAHGCFDLVHPGHLRHLIFCKQQADILVVSVTADEHILKPGLRPYVPESLRALNLAALEMVDYVFIDTRATPLVAIETLRPNIFAKGFEYGWLHSPKTNAEVAAVEAYGGKVIFTPNDVVYSSTAIINSDPPNLAIDKLHLLMNAEGVTFDALCDALNKITKLSCQVVGDLIIDGYTHASATSTSNKTPTISARLGRHETFIGGAGIVAKHVEAAGAAMKFVTVIGDDELGRMACKEFPCGSLLLDVSRPTTFKHAFVVDGYRLLKIDTVNNSPIADDLIEKIQQLIQAAQSDVLIFSDFRHGIFDRRTAASMVAFAQANPRSFLVADSQVASRWGNVLDFKGVSMIFANEREVRFALGDQDSTILSLGREAYKASGAQAMIMKLGDRGAMTFRTSAGARDWFIVDSFSRNAIDPVGAGDAMLAYASLAMKATGSAVIATILGSIAAGLECERDGNIPIDRKMMEQRIHELEELCR